MHNLKTITFSLLLFMLFWPGFLLAEQHHISVTHKLVSITPQNAYASVVFEITVSNNSLENYTSVNLVARNIDMIGHPTDHTVKVGYLPISGMHQSFWTYSSLLDMDLLTHTPVLVFDFQAKNKHGKKLNFPVYSQAEGVM